MLCIKQMTDCSFNLNSKQDLDYNMLIFIGEEKISSDVIQVLSGLK